MTTNTLIRYLQDPDAEIRRAAALAAAKKESNALIPDLIPLLEDPCRRWRTPPMRRSRR